mgnify:CR=1 FL=1
MPKHEVKDVSEYENNDINTLENYNVDENGNKTNTSSKLLEEHICGYLVFTNMKITSSVSNPKLATMVLTVRNDGEELLNRGIKVTFYDKNNKEKTFQLTQINIARTDETVEIKNDIFNRIIDTYDYSVSLYEEDGVG